MRLLVTGGAGYIGRVLVHDLVAAGHAVTVLDDLSTGDPTAVIPHARLVVGDVADADAVRAGLTGDVDAVLHLAAKLIVDESFSQRDAYERTNVDGTRVLLDQMAHTGCRRLVFSSTAAVYGDAGSSAIAEDAPLRPASPYGATKLRADQLLAEAAHSGLSAVSLRYFNVAGASGHLGEARERETHLIPLALDVALGRRDAFQLFGDDYPTSDGTPIRDYIHVCDISAAHVAALSIRPSGHRVYNVGAGRGHSVRAVLRCVERVTGRLIPVELRPRRRGDPPMLVASNGRIRAELGWAPRASALERIVADAWRFRRRRAGA
jgi:UDP-glucose 4-epimerase